KDGFAVLVGQVPERGHHAFALLDDSGYRIAAKLFGDVGERWVIGAAAGQRLAVAGTAVGQVEGFARRPVAAVGRHGHHPQVPRDVVGVDVQDTVVIGRRAAPFGTPADMKLEGSCFGRRRVLVWRVGL